MPQKRVLILMLTFLLIGSCLLVKIGYYQIAKGPEIAQKATAMRSRQVELKEYSRGDILDQNFLPLTGIKSTIAVYCLPREMGRNNIMPNNNVPGSSEEALTRAAQVLAEIIEEMDSQEIYTKLKQALKSGKSFVRIATDLKPEEADRINSSQLSGVVVAPVIKRYHEDGFLAHLLGYSSVGENSEGISGLEKLYNSILRGNTSSSELTSVLDARGIAIKGLMFKLRNEQESHLGDVVLTIDKRVQEIVEKVMNDQIKTGAVVVMDVESKEVLAMASRPTFNPYEVDKIVDDGENSSLNNRVLMAYHPGSLFKILVAAAALEEKLIDTEEKFTCTGEYAFKSSVAIPCWQENGHGIIDFSQAFALSCNPTFIEIGLRLRSDGLMNYANRLHLTDKRLLGYGDYNGGSFISIENVDPAIGNACLGQQGVMLTPLQICNLVATIADDGQYGPPVLVRFTVDLEGRKKVISRPAKEQVLSLQTAQAVQMLMHKVVSEGTGKNASLYQVGVAGKTATSQTGNFDSDGAEILNTWFAGFFPTDNPRWAIVVLAEGGKSGAENAAPAFKEIACQMLDYYPIK
ncbi:MAG: peptidoglycan D,D-transpeptidase FtsI family protein [Syntrophomonadaceae bacterium]